MFADVGYSTDDEWYDVPLSSIAIARWVWDDIQKQQTTPVSRVTVARTFEGLSSRDFGRDYAEQSKALPDPYEVDVDSEERWRRYRLQDELVQRWADKAADEFLQDLPDEAMVYRFEYADDSGNPQEGQMEHGDIFYRLPHKKISNH